MNQEFEKNSAIYFGSTRYVQPRWRALQAQQKFSHSLNEESDRYVHALAKLEQEDEEIPLPSDRGPIVFRDGLFQIDMSQIEEKGDIDIELKKLIDSIIGE